MKYYAKVAKTFDSIIAWTTEKYSVFFVDTVPCPEEDGSIRIAKPVKNTFLFHRIGSRLFQRNI